ncbi:MAG TPA: glycosyltransferase family 39 protein [Solirubrobacteraceae bacterium]
MGDAESAGTQEGVGSSVSAEPGTTRWRGYLSQSRHSLPSFELAAWRGRRWALLVFAFAIAIAVFDLIWLSRFQSGGPLTIDESGYLNIALANADALRAHGPWALISEFVGQHYEAPLVPLLAGILEVLISRTTDVGFAVLPLAAIAAVLATYGVARRFVSPAWSALAAVVTACIPAVLGYSRFFEFAVPTTAAMMLTIYALLRSEGLSRRGWSIGVGVLAGILLLTRTMTLAFLPGLVVAAGLQVAVHRRPRAPSNLVLAVVAGVIVAAIWYGRNVRYVAHYLLHFGYGGDASNFGASHPLFSWAFWSKEARIMLGDFNVPLGAVVLIGIVCGVVFLVGRLREGRHLQLRAVLGAQVTILVVIFIEGYLILSSTQNVGSGFDLPLLPIIVVLAVIGVARLTRGQMRSGQIVAAAFTTAALAASCLALLSASSEIKSLNAVSMRVPGFGVQPVFNSENHLYAELQEAGYPLSSTTQRLPAALRNWQSRMQKLAVTMSEAAASEHLSTPLVAAPPDVLYSANGFVWAARQAREQQFTAADILLSKGTASETAYRSLIEQLHVDLVVIAVPTSYRAEALGLPALEAATRAAGYEIKQRVAEPDAVLTIYWHPRRTAAP